MDASLPSMAVDSIDEAFLDLTGKLYDAVPLHAYPGDGATPKRPQSSLKSSIKAPFKDGTEARGWARWATVPSEALVLAMP